MTKSIAQVKSLLLTLFFLYINGCATAKHREPRMEAAFFHAMRDYNATTSIPLSPLFAGGLTFYWVPVSADKVLREGDLAIPTLERLGQSHDFAQVHFAELCLAIIKAKQTHKGTPVMEAQSGIKVVCYQVGPLSKSK
jgi:hypothetical protein